MRKINYILIVSIILVGIIFSCNHPDNLVYNAASRNITTTSTDYIENGVGTNVRIIGSAWTTNSGYYVGSGRDNYAYADGSIDAGDFAISATLQLDTLDWTAATFELDGSAFGFDGNSNRLFYEGGEFGSTTFIGSASAYITPDVDFLFEVIRTGTTLSYRIDGIEVWSTTYTPSRITDFGFRPWRNTMRIADFSADGNLAAYGFINPESDDFVINGVDHNMKIVGDSWVTSSAYLVGSGKDNYAYANKSIIDGDFSISATMQLDKLDGTAATFELDGSAFGFDGNSNRLFYEGGEFGSTTFIGSASAYITPDMDFLFEVTRTGTILSYRIDNVEVWTTTYTPELITDFGFRPWRNTIRIADFSATGHLEHLEPAPESQVFAGGDDGYDTFRIPAIINAPNGDLLAFAEGRVDSSSDHGNIDIVMKRSTDNGVTWGALQLIADYGSFCAGNPGPVVDMMDPAYPDGKIYLLYNTSINSESSIRSGNGIREVWYKTSTDNGLTWTMGVNITTSVNYPYEPAFNSAYTYSEDWRWYAITPGHAIQLTRGEYAGRLFIPSNHSDSAGERLSHCFYSDDHGVTWQLGGSVAVETNEVQAVELVNGDIMMNMRNYRGTNRRAVSTSSDGGATWSALWEAQDLIDPVCQASITRFTDSTNDDKNRLLFANPASTSRNNMTIKVSYDEGQSWSDGRTVYSGASAYSDLVISDDKTIGLLYEKDGYATINFAHFSIGWATLNEDTLP